MRQDNLLLNNSTINSEFNFIPSNLYNPNTNKLNYINIDSKYNNINTSPVTLINNVLISLSKNNIPNLPIKSNNINISSNSDINKTKCIEHFPRSTPALIINKPNNINKKKILYLENLNI